MLKISIVLPTFNSEDFIEETIKSIILQDYKNYELIVVDGFSTDSTLKILGMYKQHITYLISEKDNGQYEAINKGMKLASGDILCWLNSDDIYFPWTLKMVSYFFNDFKNVNWIIGTPAFINGGFNVSHFYGNLAARPQSYIKNGYFNKTLFGYLQQENMFWRREVWENFGPLDISLKLAADFELWTRFAKGYELVSVSLPLASFRVRSNSRSHIFMSQYEQEVQSVIVNFRKLRFLSFLGSKSHILNKLIRALTWKKSDVIYYSITKRKWKRDKIFRPLSSISLSNLILELF